MAVSMNTQLEGTGVNVMLTVSPSPYVIPAQFTKRIPLCRNALIGPAFEEVTPLMPGNGFPEMIVKAGPFCEKEEVQVGLVRDVFSVMSSELSLKSTSRNVTCSTSMTVSTPDPTVKGSIDTLEFG